MKLCKFLVYTVWELQSWLDRILPLAGYYLGASPQLNQGVPTFQMLGVKWFGRCAIPKPQLAFHTSPLQARGVLGETSVVEPTNDLWLPAVV